MLTSEPFLRAAISPRSGPYSWKRWLITPRPRVWLTRSVSKPIRPRIGIERFDADLVAVMVHVGDLGFAAGEVLHAPRPWIPWGFPGTASRSAPAGCPFVVLAIDHLGTRDQHFVAFAAHLLDEDGDLHFAAAADVENVRVVGLLDAQGDVGADFLHQPFPDVAGGDELAVDAGERAVVDGELHLDGRRINRHERQRRAVLANRVIVSPMNTSSKPVRPTMSPACASGTSMRFRPSKWKMAVILPWLLRAVAVDADGGVAHLDLAAVNLAEGDTAEVIGVIEVGDEQLEAFARVRARRRDVLDDGVEERLHRAADVLEVGLGVAVLGAASTLWWRR